MLLAVKRLLSGIPRAYKVCDMPFKGVSLTETVGITVDISVVRLERHHKKSSRSGSPTVIGKHFSGGSIQMKSIAKDLTHTLRKSKASILAMVVTLGIVLCATNALAQSGAGSIQGTVRDATGAVVPGASVHVVNQTTGVVTDTKSNNVGFYQVPELFTGAYDITISASGFKSHKTSIDLLVAQNAVIDLELVAGEVTQQIVVTANTVQLTTPDNGTIGSTLENDRINQLPVNGRILLTLTGMTTPGLEGQRANGLLQEGMEYTVDGVTTTNLHYGGENNRQIQIQDPDSVQEVRINMTDADAEYAAPVTAVVATKSGTNRLHGTFFETARNNAIGVAKNRANPSNYSAPPLVRNEFGASAGGPIILPHVYHGKDKSFWFFAYERYSNATRSSSLYSVPTMPMRQGDFGLYNGQGILQKIFDPSTTANSSNCAFTGKANSYCRTPFPGNKIPIGEMSPTAKILYDLIPQPTSNANPLVAKNLTANSNAFQVIAQETFRLDHAFDDSNRAYLRFSDIDCPVQITGSPRSLAADGIPAGAAQGYANNPGQTFYASVGYTHIFSPTFFAETIAGQQWLNTQNLVGADPNINYEGQLGLPNNFGESGFPSTSGLLNNFTSSQTGTFSNQIISDLDENLTKIMGSHQLHFGGRFRHERMADLPQGLADSIAFGGNSTGIYDTSTGGNYGTMPNTGNADASFFLGSAASYTINLEPPHDHYHVNEIDAYLQDSYHVSRNLTLSLGLRYEAHPAAWNKYGLMNSFDFKNDAMVLAVPPSTLIAEGYTTQAIIANDKNIGVKFETPEEAGMPATTLLRNYNLNFLPRAGFAYQLFGRKYGTVIRGAYGRYDFQTPMQDYLNHPQKNNPLIATYSQSYSLASQAIDGLPNELLRYNDPVKFGVMGVNTANVVNSLATNSIVPGISQWFDSPDWPPSFVTEMNFTVEQPLKGNSALRVSWVWNHSTNLDIAHNFNNHPGLFQWEMATGTALPTGGASVIGTPLQNTYAATATGPYDQTIWGSGSSLHIKTGWSNVNALQVNYQRLFHHGVAYQFSYVFSKAMRMGGDGQGVDPYANYLGALGTVATMTSPYGTIGPVRVPPLPPANVPAWANYHALNTYENYSLDSAIPYHHITFNGIVDLPFGRGKRFFGNVNRFVDEVIGGFQVAGDGSIVSQVFAAPTGNWGAVAPLKVYKHKYPVQDCRSGVCYKAYMWSNGYLPPTVTTGVTGSVCTKNCISGLPASYVPAQIPIDNDPTSPYYGGDKVQITAPHLNNGKPTDIAFDAGPQSAQYYAHKWLNGPFNWSADASIFKVFLITKRVNLRVNMDAFNVFNVQGYNNPDSSGLEQVQPGAGQASSHNTPRQVQLTMRLTF